MSLAHPGAASRRSTAGTATGSVCLPDRLTYDCGAWFCLGDIRFRRRSVSLAAARTVNGSHCPTRGWILGGAALAANAEAARRWFQVVHLKSLPALLPDPDVSHQVDAFITECQQPDGQVVTPTGAHLIDFWKRGPRRHLPPHVITGQP